MPIITIIGAGMMGSALSIPACDNNNIVKIVGTPLDDDIIERLKKDSYHLNLKRFLPEGIEYYHFSEIKNAVPNSDLYISGVSSFGVDWFLKSIIPILPENIPVLSVTKGLIEDENKKLISIPEYYEKNINYSDRRSFNAIGGPCTSYELADRHQTIVCYCGKGIKTLEYIRKMLQTEYYHIELSDDIAGTECAVAMKNAYALAVSLGIGLPERTEGKSCIEHYNLQAALFLQSTRELKRIVKLVGGREESLVYGVGDLYVTIFGGRTRKIGTLLGRGMTFMEAMKELSGITLESVSITRNCCRALIDTGTDIECFPLLMHIYDIIENGADVDIPFEKFK